MELKSCSTCKAKKPRNEFYKNKISSDGLQSQCKACHIACANRGPRYAERQKAWRQRHPDRHCHYQSLRRARRRKAFPVWANREAIKEIYRKAREMTKATGEQFVVDHIVPLKSNLVCGLHCESNLQVISFRENGQKHNRYWPDMP